MKNIDWMILKTLYEKKSITKTAEVLYVTQSALTKRIKTIEEEWGIEIVKRSSTGVVFTDDGHYLVNKAIIMLDFLSEIEEHFTSGQSAKEFLKIGVPNSFARLHMPKLLKGYVDDYDKIQFKTIPNSSDIIMQKLMDGTIDMGIVCGDYPYMGEKIRLFEEGLYVAAPMGTKLDDVGQMPLIESYLNPMVKLLTDQWWKNQFGNMPHSAHFVPYADIAIEMVENGLGVCFLFGADWKLNMEELQLIPIYDKENYQVSRSVWLMVSERCFRSQDMMDFVTFVEQYYQVN